VKEATANKMMGMALGGAVSTQIDVAVWIQYVGAVAAVVGVLFSGAYYLSLIVIRMRRNKKEAAETERSNLAKEAETKRCNDEMIKIAKGK